MDDLIVNVNIWGKDVGSLMWDEQNNIASFAFERNFLKSGLDLSPIVMPLSRSGNDKVYQFLGNKNECFNGLPGLIADSLPDKFGTQIINEWFLSEGMPDERISPLDRLCYVGKRGMGALEFSPSHSLGIESSSVLHIEELTRLADSVFKNRDDFQANLRGENKSMLDILKVGTSAGGAKPKAIIAYNDLTNEVRSGQVKAPDGFGYWLLKFDGTTFSEHGKISDNPKGIGNIEYAYHLMAKDCGIDMTECRLLNEGDYNHFMTKRFDRLDDGEKLHVQTLAAIGHLNRDTRHSYEEVFSLMRRMRLPYKQQEQLYRRMVFNVVSRNHDDHTKNLSFLMNKNGEWSLAPAYDLCYSYSPSGKWTARHQMSINGKQDGFTYADLFKVGKIQGINKPKEIIENVVDVVAGWKRYAKDSGVEKAYTDSIYKNLILMSKLREYENEL